MAKLAATQAWDLVSRTHIKTGVQRMSTPGLGQVHENPACRKEKLQV